MNLGYSINEAFAALNRTKVASFISIASVTFLLLLIGTFSLLVLNVDHIVTMLNAKVDIQVYISNTLSDEETGKLQSLISNITFVEGVEFISKDKAAKEFEEEFGKDLFDLLEENPLPSSFHVKISQESWTLENLQLIAEQVKTFSGVDEVVYHQQALEILRDFERYSRIVLIMLVVIVFLGSLFLISNALRLGVYARRHIIDTMFLVGATKWFISKPLLLEGFIQGFLGGLQAFVILFIVVKLVLFRWPNAIIAPDIYLLSIIGAGIILGFFASLFAIRKFL